MVLGRGLKDNGRETGRYISQLDFNNTDSKR
jgi:hypothetical protein